MKSRLFTLLLSLIGCGMCMAAQPGIYAGTQNRIVTFARFNNDPEFDMPRSEFESMFNGPENSLKSYFSAISNDRLNVNSLMFPANTGVNSSFELTYCYFCYEKNWKGSYPQCKGSNITSATDINVAFVIQELVDNLEDTQDVPAADLLDMDNDGYVDNFVVVLRGTGRGKNKGIHSSHTGTISETYIKANGPIMLNGKEIKNYTVTFERNSLETNCQLMLNHLGFPNLYPLQGGRFVGQWDPMDGPKLSYPLTYNRMKYTGGAWIDEIPVIDTPGVYELSASVEATNNAYRIASENPQQFWVLEFRDNTAPWETTLPEKGLIIYRVNTAYTGVIAKNSEIYVYRKGGTATEIGNLGEAAFSNANGRTAFGHETDPSPFFADGTISGMLDISDITIKGDKVSFRVNKVAGVDEVGVTDWGIYISAGAPRTVHLLGEGIETVNIYDYSGREVGAFKTADGMSLDLSGQPSGVYMALLKSGAKQHIQKFILK